MKKKWGFCLVAILFLLTGCQNPITDVGNPTSQSAMPSSKEENPSTAQLLGNYGELPSANVSGGSGGSAPSAPASDSIPSCQSDFNAVKSIAAGSKSNQIILSNFMSYSMATKQITATYEDGNLFFDVVDSKVDIGCDGEASFSGSSIVINLTCDLVKPVKTTCRVLYEKQF